MTAHPPAPGAGSGPQPDLEYDLVHDDLGAQGEPTGASSGQAPPVQVPTRTDAYDGDYGYDLAHDIPRS